MSKLIDEEIRKHQTQGNIRLIVIISLAIIVVLAVLGLIAFEIYIWIHYGNMPKDQIPAWVWWWMLGRKN